MSCVDYFMYVICQTNRAEMTLEAKRAAKIEKKLKILLGGYQVFQQSISGVLVVLIFLKFQSCPDIVLKSELVLKF